jgi:hypothetical protein
MAQKEFDFNEFITYLEAKKKALETVIASVKAASELGALGPIRFPRLGEEAASPAVAAATSAEPIELPVGALSSKSLPDAIKLYLSAVRKKQTNKEIEAGLKEGGVETTAQNFSTSVGGALFRLKKSGELLRFKDGWGLSEHYSEHLRSKLSQDSKQAPKKKNRKGGKGKARKIAPAAVKPLQSGLEQRIEAVLKADRSKVYLPREIAECLKIDHIGIVAAALGRMASKNKADKLSGGKYQAPALAHTQEAPRVM